jgi:hypothetical protein
LLIILAIGCDENNEAVELNEASSEMKWNPEEGGESVFDDYHLQRAGVVVKAQQAINLLTQKEVLNPYRSELELEQRIPNCTIEKSTVAENLQSACDTMPTMGFIHTIECDFSNGNHFQADIKVSVETLHHYDDFFLLAGPLLIDDVVQTETEAANLFLVDISLETSNYVMEVSNPHSRVDSGSPGYATYEVDNTQRGRSKRGITRSTFRLTSATQPEMEIEEMDLWSIDRDTNKLLPDFGQLRLPTLHGKRLYFNSKMSDDDKVSTRPFFRHGNVVDIPAL